MRHLALALLLVLATIPAAQAGHTPDCSTVTETVTVDAEKAYVREAGDQVEIWQETNGADGLQTQACTNAAGDHVDADTLHATLPQDAVDLAGEMVGTVFGVVGTVFDLVIAICNAVVGILGHYRCF